MFCRWEGYHRNRIRRPVLDHFGPEDKPEIEMVQNRPSNPTHRSDVAMRDRLQWFIHNSNCSLEA